MGKRKTAPGSAPFAKVTEDLLTSSVWDESPEVRCVWIMFVVARDRNGFVAGTPETFRRLANVPLEAVNEALAKFQSKDPTSRNPDNEGRRIAIVPGGVVVLNHWAFRMKDVRAEHAAYMKAWRAKNGPKQAGNTPAPKASEDGCESHVNHSKLQVSHGVKSLSVSVLSSDGGQGGNGKGSGEGIPGRDRLGELLAGLVATGKFPRLDRAGLGVAVLPCQGWERVVDEVVAEARICPDPAIGAPIPWLRAALGRHLGLGGDGKKGGGQKKTAPAEVWAGMGDDGP
jgi:hypothetical protein